ncbi:hypothetical protein, partial [Paenibacillus sp. DS2015]|uniref:hypothetical protein n=1 Tax=Paenibacillus sp. DS2015 TaxID=3373917 RepID=UPI003D1B58F7
NVIKLISKTRAKIKMESETAWGKVLCRLFFVQARKKAYSKQSGWNIRLKNVHVNRIMLLCRRS